MLAGCGGGCWGRGCAGGWCSGVNEITGGGVLETGVEGGILRSDGLTRSLGLYCSSLSAQAWVGRGK